MSQPKNVAILIFIDEIAVEVLDTLAGITAIMVKANKRWGVAKR